MNRSSPIGPIEFGILGTLRASAGGHPIDPGPGKVRTVLGILLLHPNQLVSGDRLVDALWGDDAPASAANTLQGYVSSLRKRLGATVITTRSPGYVLTVDTEQIDACRFERLVSAGRAALKEDRAEAAQRLLCEALSLWRGDALADFAFYEFAQGEIARLHELRLVAAEERFEAELALGRHASIADGLASLARENPVRERLWGQLMIALYRCGHQAEALRALSELRRHLLEELGIEPSAALRQLENDILHQRSGLDWRPRMAAATDDGLPTYRSSFVGREAELVELDELVASGRIVTVTGPGGIGKTRLAVELARRAKVRFAGGVLLIELGAVADANLVPEVIAAALGVADVPSGSLREALAMTLGGRRLLVVLDNCEHVAGAAATVVDTLLQVALGVAVLATSREPLRVDGERVWRAHPLAPAPSVRLFVDRAAARGPLVHDVPTATAVSQLCQRLDGLPLAIELAAARSPGLTPGEMLSALDRRFTLLDRGSRAGPARHQTLRAAVEWSHESLTPDEAIVFRRLSVFKGGFTLAAARRVVADDQDSQGVEPELVAGLLAALVDKSLLSGDQHSAETRYHQLETIREYAWERLVEAGESFTPLASRMCQRDGRGRSVSWPRPRTRNLGCGPRRSWSRAPLLWREATSRERSLPDKRLSRCSKSSATTSGRP